MPLRQRLLRHKIVGGQSWVSLGITMKNQAVQVVWVAGLLVCAISLMALVKRVLFRGQPRLQDEQL